jgi:L-glutamine-phosphate cytidylyltransferase
MLIGQKLIWCASLLCAKDLIDQPTVVSYSDIVYDASIVSDLISSHGDLCVAYDKQRLDLWRARFTDPLSDAESLKVNNSHHIIEIGDTVKRIAEIEGQFIGLLRFNPKSISWVEELIKSDPSLLLSLDMTVLLRTLISSGHTIQGVETRAKWCEIDSVTDLSVAEKVFREENSNISPVSTRS